MANRFNAVFYSKQHASAKDTLSFAWATIRPADHGITAIEWERGVRILKHDCPSTVELETYLKDNCYELLDTDSWSSFVNSLDEDNVPNNNFIYPRKADKWDTRPEVY